MKSRHKKLILIIAALVLGTVVIILAAAGYKYIQTQNQDPVINAPKNAAITPKKVTLGSPVNITATFKSTWNSYTDEESLLASKGAQAVGKAKIKCTGIGWGTCTWSVTARMQPFETGTVPESKLVVDFQNTNKGTEQKFTVPVPKFDVSELKIKDPASLALASKMSLAGRPGYVYLLVGIGITVFAILLILTVIWWTSPKRQRKITLPPWSIALAEIRELSSNLKKGLISGEACIGKLTDIVRYYLEKQFRLHAQTQTTKEFLHELERPGGPLRENHRTFLKDFMTAADLVKFANCPADTSLIDNAFEKADVLINETKPAEKNDQQKGNRS